MKNNELWELVLKDIKDREQVSSASYKSFFLPLSLRETQKKPDIAYLQAEKDLIANVIRRRYLHVIEESFRNVTGSDWRVLVRTTAEYSERPRVISGGSPSTAFDLNINFNKEKIFNPRYTFDNFVVGECNKYAQAACLAVAKSPSDIYNPLFIYGSSGLGKTHLMNAVGIYLLEHNSNMKVLYVSSETFTNDFIKALQEGKTGEFKNKYRKVDALLIDDIQFLEGKKNMQEEFFYTFNALYEDNKQIIISGDRPPNRLNELNERLRSRFSWNMIAEIQPPDYETRVAILGKKAENMDVETDSDMYAVMELISEKITDNVRELEGAFIRIISFSQLMGERVSLQFAKRILKDIIQSGSVNITPEKIKSAVCRHYRIKISDLESETRKSSIAYPRQVAMYLVRTMTDLSFPKIGAIFGNKHYSTVKHACDKIDMEIRDSEELKREIEELRESIGE